MFKYCLPVFPLGYMFVVFRCFSEARRRGERQTGKQPQLEVSQDNPRRKRRPLVRGILHNVRQQQEVGATALAAARGVGRAWGVTIGHSIARFSRENVLILFFSVDECSLAENGMG